MLRPRRIDRIIKDLLKSVKRVHGAVEPVREFLNLINDGASASLGHGGQIDEAFFSRVEDLSVAARRIPGPPPPQPSHLRPSMLIDPATRKETIRQLRAYGLARDERLAELETLERSLQQQVVHWMQVKDRSEAMLNAIEPLLGDPIVVSYFNELQHGYFDLDQLVIKLVGLVHDQERALAQIRSVLPLERRENEGYNEFMRQILDTDREPDDQSRPTERSSRRKKPLNNQERDFPNPTLGDPTAASNEREHQVRLKANRDRMDAQMKAQREQLDAQRRQHDERVRSMNQDAARRRQEEQERQRREADRQRVEAQRKQEDTRRKDVQRRLEEQKRDQERRRSIEGRKGLEEHQQRMAADRERMHEARERAIEVTNRQRVEQERRQRLEAENRQRIESDRVKREAAERQQRETERRNREGYIFRTKVP